MLPYGARQTKPSAGKEAEFNQKVKVAINVNFIIVRHPRSARSFRSIIVKSTSTHSDFRATEFPPTRRKDRGSASVQLNVSHRIDGRQRDGFLVDGHHFRNQQSYRAVSPHSLPSPTSLIV